MHAIILEEHKQIKLKPKLIYKVMLHPTQLKLTHSSMKSMAIEIYAHVHPMPVCSILCYLQSHILQHFIYHILFSDLK